MFKGADIVEPFRLSFMMGYGRCDEGICVKESVQGLDLVYSGYYRYFTFSINGGGELGCYSCLRRFTEVQDATDSNCCAATSFALDRALTSKRVNPVNQRAKI
jgi:hypothetical protein